MPVTGQPEPAGSQAEQRSVVCRLCEGRCGLVAVIEHGRLARVQGDPDDPVSRGYVCDTARASLGALTHAQRITAPLRRDASGQLVAATWDQAFAELGPQLAKLRRRHGGRALGLYLGDPVQLSSRALARSLAVGVAAGTPNIFSTLCSGAGPRLQVSEWMLGQATPLLSDVGRAHYVALLGDDPTRTNWGPMQAGMAHADELLHSRRTKGTMAVVASPRRSEFADRLDQHLAIRPGTEGWLLLGLLSAVVGGDWIDHQHVRDYTLGYDDLVAALAPFSVERCADICGVDPAALSGIALKMSRAAMATIHAGPGTFTNAMPTLSAWAWLALHTVTANTLRPGGIYAGTGLVDLQPALQAVRSADAPETRVGHHRLLLLQAPGTALADECLTPGPGQLHALICVQGDPLLDLPASGRTRDALKQLDLLVCLTDWRGPATEQADWVLPVTQPWEQRDVQVLEGMLLPVSQVALSPAVVTAPEQVRTVDAILRELYRAVHPGLLCGVFGLHLSLGARWLAGADLDPWETRMLDWMGGIDSDDLAPAPHRVLRGQTDRARWAVGHADGRIRLLPPQVADLLAKLSPAPADPQRPLWLRTSARGQRAPDPLHRTPDADPGVRVHPDVGIQDGAQVAVETRYGRITATARLDPRLRPDTVDLPMGFSTDAMALLAPDGQDPITGTPCLDGLACRLLPV
ncbi:MAG: molybdopterin-dependent oxidoreductase [Oligoflexia bacterium]|nr:molybdopterin-dependent oxidoreductase [Oligoflexia bacterium]